MARRSSVKAAGPTRATSKNPLQKTISTPISKNHSDLLCLTLRKLKKWKIPQFLKFSTHLSHQIKIHLFFPPLPLTPQNHPGFYVILISTCTAQNTKTVRATKPTTASKAPTTTCTSKSSPATTPKVRGVRRLSFFLWLLNSTLTSTLLSLGYEMCFPCAHSAFEHCDKWIIKFVKINRLEWFCFEVNDGAFASLLSANKSKLQALSVWQSESCWTLRLEANQH